MADGGEESVRKSPRKNYVPKKMVRREIAPASPVDVEIKQEPPDDYEGSATPAAMFPVPAWDSPTSSTKTHHKRHKKHKSPKEKHKKRSKSESHSVAEDAVQTDVVGEKRVCQKVAKRAKHHSKSKGHDKSPHSEGKPHRKHKHRTGEPSVETTPTDGVCKKAAKKHKHHKSETEKSEKRHKKHKRKSVEMTLEKSVKEMVGDIESQCQSAESGGEVGSSVKTAPSSTVTAVVVPIDSSHATKSCASSDDRDVSSTTTIVSKGGDVDKHIPVVSQVDIEPQNAASEKCSPDPGNVDESKACATASSDKSTSPVVEDSHCSGSAPNAESPTAGTTLKHLAKNKTKKKKVKSSSKSKKKKVPTATLR